MKAIATRLVFITRQGKTADRRGMTWEGKGSKSMNA